MNTTTAREWRAVCVRQNPNAIASKPLAIPNTTTSVATIASMVGLNERASIASDGTLIGVWDVDSPVAARFDDEDRQGMEAL